MIPFDVNEIRNWTIKDIPNSDFDFEFTFYNDETNNSRKFYVKDEGFNYLLILILYWTGFFGWCCPVSIPKNIFIYPHFLVNFSVELN